MLVPLVLLVGAGAGAVSCFDCFVGAGCFDGIGAFGCFVGVGCS